MPIGPETSQIADAAAPRSLKGILTGLSVALLCLQTVLWARISFEDLRFGILCLAALVALVSTKRQSVTLGSDPASTIAGLGIILFVICRTSGEAGTLFAAVAPVFWGAGLLLVATGVSGLAQFWKEGLVLGAVVITPFVETFMLDFAGIDLTPVTAQAAAYILRITGWEASASGMLINLPTAWIVVAQGCSGLKTMYFLTGFAVIVLLVFPVPGAVRKLVSLVGACLIGFIVNAGRVAVLAAAAAPDRRQAFKFWHVQQGAMFFEALAAGLFLIFFYFLMPERRSRSLTRPQFPK